MYRRMLIPLDRSEFAEIVLPYAKQLAGRLGLEIILMNVIRQEDSNSYSKYKSYLEKKAELLVNQSHYLQRKSGIKGNTTVLVHKIISIGNPAEEILCYSEQNNIDLILMATHGRSGISRWALGSVADKVLRKSKTPVFLVRSGVSDSISYDNWSKLTMLVPLDGSKLAESVLPHVEALAKQPGVKPEVVLLRVIDPPTISYSSLEMAPQPDWEKYVKQLNENYRNEYEQYATGIKQHLSSSGINVRAELSMGEPAEEIIRFANENQIDLIIMATHGRSGISRWAFGSISDKVLRRASHPLFLVRAVQTE